MLCPLTLGERITVFFSNAEAKANLMLDVSRQLARDASIKEIADDFDKYGNSLEKLIGKRLKWTLQNAKAPFYAFEGIVNNLTLETIKTAVETDKMADGFMLAKESVEKSEGLFGSLVFGFIWPSIKIIAVLLGVSLLGQYVFSQLTQIVPVRRWPGLAQITYDITGAISDSATVLLVFFALVVIWVSITIRFATGRVRQVIDKVPFFKQYRIMTASLTLTSLSMLLKSGISFLDAIKFLEKRSKPYVAWHLKEIRRNITRVKGASVGQMLGSGLVNDREIQRLSRPIEENMIADRLTDSSSEHSLQLERQIKRIKFTNNIIFILFLVLSVALVFSSVLFLVLSINTV